MSGAAHQHEFKRRKESSSVELCACGRFRFTENAGPSIKEIPPYHAPVEPGQTCPRCKALEAARLDTERENAEFERNRRTVEVKDEEEGA